jgi:low affinity Fe/Cu permease
MCWSVDVRHILVYVSRFASFPIRGVCCCTYILYITGAYIKPPISISIGALTSTLLRRFFWRWSTGGATIQYSTFIQLEYSTNTSICYLLLYHFIQFVTGRYALRV